MIAHPPSLELHRRARQGNQQALDALFAAERRRLRRLLSLRAGAALLQRFDVDDLVQEAYLEALRCYAGYAYRGPDSFFRWLTVVSLNRLNNLRREVLADKRGAGREVRISGEETAMVGGGVCELPAGGPGPRTLSFCREQERALAGAIEAMPSLDREIVTLARFEGMRLADIANRVGLTRNAVALRLSRALRRLQRSVHATA